MDDDSNRTFRSELFTYYRDDGSTYKNVHDYSQTTFTLEETTLESTESNDIDEPSSKRIRVNYSNYSNNTDTTDENQDCKPSAIINTSTTTTNENQIKGILKYREKYNNSRYLSYGYRLADYTTEELDEQTYYLHGIPKDIRYVYNKNRLPRKQWSIDKASPTCVRFSGEHLYRESWN